MRQAQLLAIGMAALLAPGCLHTPLAWSPDGRWLAYTVAVRPRTQVLKPGWLFDPSGTSCLAPLSSDRQLTDLHYRLWATRAETGESVLLEDSRGPLSSPSWSPEGTALAFSRVVNEVGAERRYEVVIQDAPSHKRVIQSWPVQETLRHQERALPALAVAWSPDGRHLAVPRPAPRGLAILRADNGRVMLDSIEDGYLPSWSPDGSKLAFYRKGNPDGLYWVDTNFGPPRRLSDVAWVTQPPIWARDGQSIMVVRRGTAKDKAEAHIPVLVRLRVDSGQEEWAHALVSENPEAKAPKIEGISLAFDPDGEEALFSIRVAEQPGVISWCRLRNGEIYKRFAPFDFTTPLGAIAIGPSGKRMALRIGPPDAAAPPGLYDLGSEQFWPVVPDDDARLEWLATTLCATARIIRAIPAPMMDGHEVERATLLPEPGELARQEQDGFRLRSLAKTGRALCDRPADAPPADAELQAVLDECRLFFDYLLKDYAGALAALDAVERRAAGPDQRLRLLGLRAQIFIGQRDFTRAWPAVTYLRSVEPRIALQLDDAIERPGLSELSRSGRRWSDFLARRADSAKPAEENEPADPNAPRAGLGLEPPELPLNRPDAVRRGLGPFAPDVDRANAPFPGEIEGLNPALPRGNGEGAAPEPPPPGPPAPPPRAAVAPRQR